MHGEAMAMALAPFWSLAELIHVANGGRSFHRLASAAGPVAGQGSGHHHHQLQNQEWGHPHHQVLILDVAMQQ